MSDLFIILGELIMVLMFGRINRDGATDKK